MAPPNLPDGEAFRHCEDEGRGNLALPKGGTKASRKASQAEPVKAHFNTEATKEQELHRGFN